MKPLKLCFTIIPVVQEFEKKKTAAIVNHARYVTSFI